MKPTRIVRRLGFDGNPLRRRTDRIEAWLTLAALLVLFLVGPLLVWRAGAAGYRSAVRTDERYQRERPFQVSARLDDDPAKYFIDDGDGSPQHGPVPARWTAPDGTAHSGAIVPPPGAHLGSTVVISTDARGNPFHPAAPPDPAWSAASVGTAAGVGLVGVVGFVLLVVRKVLNRRRMAGWQMEWLLVERRWTGRL